MNGLRIQKPCQESWDGMLPNSEGRFCGSCQKTVVDFTSYSDQQVKEYFLNKPAGERTCGRFLNRQLDQKVIVISSKALYSSKLSFHQFFFLCVLICFTSFFSCMKKGDGKWEDIRIELANSVVNKKNEASRCKDIKSGNSSNVEDPEKPPLQGEVDAGNRNSSSRVLVTLGDIEVPDPNENLPDSLKEYMFVDEEPIFQVDSSFSSYFSKRIQNPHNHFGKMFVSFLIDKQGVVQKPSLLKGITEDGVLERNVLEELKKMPAWKPGFNDGKPVNVRMNIPIVFDP